MSATRTSPSPARTPLNGTALLVVAGVLWGAGGLAGSYLADRAGLDPVAVAAYRLLCGGALIVLYAMATGTRPAGAGRAVWLRVGFSGLLLATFQAAYFAAVAATSVGLATLTTMVAVPVLITVGAAVLDRRLPDARTAGAVALAVAGLLLLLGGDGAAGGPLLAGTALALLAAASFATFSLWFARRTTPANAADLGLGFLTGGLVLLPFAAASGMTLPLRPDALGALAFLVLLPTAVAYVAYFTALRVVRPTAAVIGVLLEPLTATLLSVALAGERLSAAQTAGAVVVLASIALQSSGPRPERPAVSG
ncbi:DMT family transporter [Streptomyces sp. NPDC017979]|uniref:DMT family transporter n=1 Tax=Streptomyces sp. NPDC017979 TaxID=3365024 RepID=UPI0037913FA5